MTDLYRDQSSNPLWNAQRNLCGRTHYVDDDTLKFHKSRVLSARATDNGLLFAIVTSDARDHQNTRRGMRYVIFDIFGFVVERNPAKLELEWFSSSEKATKAMWDALNRLDAYAITRDAIDRTERHYAQDIARLRGELSSTQKDTAA
jgi:hypothetical protein